MVSICIIELYKYVFKTRNKWLPKRFIDILKHYFSDSSRFQCYINLIHLKRTIAQ